MKKTVIIFMIAFCLLSFTGVSSLAKEITSEGELWNGLTEMEKASYVRGFRDGIDDCLIKLVPLIKDKDIGLHSVFLDIALRELYDLRNFIWEHGKAVRTVMDDLYKDPANIYIHFPSMCKIACQKLKGEDVEQLLKKARKEGYLHQPITYPEYKEKKKTLP